MKQKLRKEIKTVEDVIDLAESPLHFCATCQVVLLTLKRWKENQYIPEKYHGLIADTYNISIAELRHINKKKAA